MHVVPDTSVVIDGRVSERVTEGDLADGTVLVPEAVVGELEGQANAGRESGWQGLEELERLVELADAGRLTVEYVDTQTSADETAVDAIVRQLAATHDAVLLTSDVVQSAVARAKGIEVEYLEPRSRDVEHLAIERFFDKDTMSVHLKVGTRPMAKRGEIGAMHYEAVATEPSTEGELKEWAREIENGTRQSPNGFIELAEPGMTIVQFREFRIAIARPPFADALEITAVRPIVVTDLEDYEFATELKDRLLERQRGVLISGAPGAGKSTFAQAVASFLAANDFAVKTMEKPRDLQVGPEITQYTALDGDMAKTADSLLMVRPDYTIYDEVRKTSDFEVFADMRLAGVGMIGVVHATRAIDALQRLVGRVELGMIPQVVDTVVYIDAGEVATVYDVETAVKVPEGLMEEDLARPVIVVNDFETGAPAYEIYTFNRQVVTVPVGAGGPSESGVDRIARQEVEREIRSIAAGDVAVELQGGNRAVVYVEDRDISSVIGKGGGRISDVERRLGISLDVRTFAERPGDDQAEGSPASARPEGDVVTPEVTGSHVRIPLDSHAGETVEVCADGEYLFTATVSRAGEVQVSRGSAIADELEAAIDRGRTITVVAQ